MVMNSGASASLASTVRAAAKNVVQIVIAAVAEGGEDEGDDAVRPPQDVDEAAEQHGHADHERLEAVGVLVAEATEEPADVAAEKSRRSIWAAFCGAYSSRVHPADAFRNHA